MTTPSPEGDKELIERLRQSVTDAFVIKDLPPERVLSTADELRIKWAMLAPIQVEQHLSVEDWWSVHR